MLTVNLVLFSNSSLLVSQVSLLIGPERVIGYLGIRRILSIAYAAPGALPRPYIRHALIPLEAIVFASYRGLVANRAIVVQRLSHDAVAEMFNATYTVEHINVTVVDAASKFRHPALGLLGYHRLSLFLLVLVLNFKRRRVLNVSRLSCS